MSDWAAHELAIYQGHVPSRRHLWGHCPGLSCPDMWHEGGCEPFWQYVSADGLDISNYPYPDDDATEKRWWQGPDGPDAVWIKVGGGWQRN